MRTEIRVIVQTYIVGSLSTNCYVVTCEKTGKSVIIDPGGISHALIHRVQEIDVDGILLTHGHFDHIAGLGRIGEITRAPSRIHADDADLLSDPISNGSFMIGEEITAPPAAGIMVDGDIITFGESSLRVMHTPGHTPGGVSFVGDTFVLSGDTLFRLSVGRWDLPGGDYGALMASVEKFRDLSDDLVLYPGHGEPSTIAFEKKHNEFLAVM